jgi:hypothetical protein
MLVGLVKKMGGTARPLAAFFFRDLGIGVEFGLTAGQRVG